MKRLLLIILAMFAMDAFAGFSAGRSSSSPSRSYSAPRSSYSAPKPRYVAPPSQYRSRPSVPAPAPTVHNHTTIVQQQAVQSGGSGGGGWFLPGLMGFMAGRAMAPDPAGQVCSGGGCSQRVCQPVPQVTP